jgi:hypothetical protein
VPTFSKVTLGAGVAFVLAACASHNKGPCEPVSAELVRFVARAVYRDCEVTTKAVLPRELRTVPYAGVTAGCVRASIEVVVDSAGWPLMPTARIVTTTDPAYAAVVIAALGRAQYTPAQKDGRPVAQLTTLDRSTTPLNPKVPFAVKRADGPIVSAPPPSRC